MNIAGELLANIWDRLRELGGDYFTCACEEVGFSEDFAEELGDFYRICAETEYDGAHLELVAWIAAQCGLRSQVSPMEFEAGIPTLREGGRLVAPGWALGLASPGSWRQRLPCRFFAQVGGPSVGAAYEGLVSHLELLLALPQEPPRELALTSLVWRVCAIADGLDDGGDRTSESMKRRLGDLRWLVREQWRFSDMEKATWKAIDDLFALRRNVLTHLGDRPEVTFGQCVQQAIEDGGSRLRESAAAISLAVAQRIFQELTSGEPPAHAARAVRKEMQL